MPLFRRRGRKTFAQLVEERAQLVAELEAVDADVAWTGASDDRMELAESSSLRRQADALRKSIAELDRQITEAARGDG